MRRSAYTLVAAVSYPLVRFAFRTRWKGRDHVPETGGVVLAASHFSNFDPWPVALGLYPQRHLRFMAKIELFRLRPFGAVLQMLGGFPVDRKRPDREALATAVELCRSGEMLLMFPEGTRRHKGAWKQRQPIPHTGAARIALRAGVPLVPVGISGTDRLGRFGPITVTYGPPVPTDDLEHVSKQSAARIMTSRLMSAIDEVEAASRGR